MMEANPYILEIGRVLKWVLSAVLITLLVYLLLKMLIDLRRNHFD